MPDKRLEQLRQLLESARRSGKDSDQDTIEIIEQELFNRLGFDPAAKKSRVKRSKGSPPEGETAVMSATSNRATNGSISRGGGAALRGLKFTGVK